MRRKKQAGASTRYPRRRYRPLSLFPNQLRDACGAYFPVLRSAFFFGERFLTVPLAFGLFVIFFLAVFLAAMSLAP